MWSNFLEQKSYLENTTSKDRSFHEQNREKKKKKKQSENITATNPESPTSPTLMDHSQSVTGTP
jgi:hypothetical protein